MHRKIIGTNAKESLVKCTVVGQTKDEAIAGIIASILFDWADVSRMKQLLATYFAHRTLQTITPYNAESKSSLVRSSSNLRTSMHSSRLQLKCTKISLSQHAQRRFGIFGKCDEDLFGRVIVVLDPAQTNIPPLRIVRRRDHHKQG